MQGPASVATAQFEPAQAASVGSVDVGDQVARDDLTSVEELRYCSRNMITSRSGSRLDPLGCGKQLNDVRPHRSESNSATSMLGCCDKVVLPVSTQSTSKSHISSRSPGAAGPL